MKKFVKKFLKWTGITLLLLIIAIILIPILFKDQIKELVVDEVNKTLNAELSLGDFDLTFLSSFPNVTAVLYDTKLQGIDDFKDVTLADVKELKAHVGLWSVIGGDQIEIDEIHIIEPTIDVRVLQNGLANYDIVKPDSVKTPEEIEEPSNFKLSLKEYSISNGNIRYDDKASDMSANIVGLNHTGSGDLTADVIDFITSTQMEELSFEMEGIGYLSKVKTDADVNLLMEFKEASSKYTLKDNKISLNELGFSVDGYYEMLDGYDDMDIKLNASEATFKQFLSLIPTFYQSGYESMVSSGNLSLAGFVKGKMDATNMPAWDFGAKISNASINYPDLPGKISNIQVDAGSKFPGGSDLDKMTADVTKFHANLGKNEIDGNLMLRSMMTDPFIQSAIKANMDLSTIKDFVPMAEGESYSGILDADVNIKGRMSDLEKEDYEAFTAEGNLLLSDMNYVSPDLNEEVIINKMGFAFSPQNLALTELSAKTGKSDFNADGKIDNYMGYMLRDEVLKGSFNFNSNYLDLDQLMNIVPAEEGEVATTTTETSEEPVLIPGNIDFALATNIKEARYNGIDVKNINGLVTLKDEVAYLNDLTVNAMGGSVGLKGSYNTQNHTKPVLDFAYKLKDIDIHELSTHFLTIEKLAPITKYAQGKISSELTMKSDLTASFEPILSSLTSIGDIRSSSISIKDFELFKKISNTTKLNNFSSQTLKDFYTKFKVNDGKIELSPFNTMLGKIGTNISGYTTLDQKMDYTMKMEVPKEEIPKEMIAVVEDAMSKLNSISPKLNVGSLPAKIPVKVFVQGDTKNPKITSDFKEAILKATGNYKDELINSVKETVKDTITNIVNDKVDEIKENFEEQKQKILADAQVQANKVKAETKKAADQIRAEADKQANDLIAAAGSNPLKKKAAEIAAKKLRDEAEVKAVKVEQEGDKKADAIMTKARERADALGN